MVALHVELGLIFLAGVRELLGPPGAGDRAADVRDQHGDADRGLLLLQLVPEHLAQRQHRALRDHVAAGARPSREARRRGGVDDVPFLAALQHDRDEDAQRVDHPPEVGPERPLPVALAGRPDGDVAGVDPDVVAEHVHAAEFLGHARGQRLDALAARDVGLDGDHARAALQQLLLRGREGVPVEVGDGDRHALAGEAARHGGAEHSAAAHHHRDLAGELLHRAPPRPASRPSCGAIRTTRRPRASRRGPSQDRIPEAVAASAARTEAGGSPHASSDLP